MPAAIAIVVITIGRARLRPASSSAVRAVLAARLLLDREIDQHDRVLGDDAHQHQQADIDRHRDRLVGGEQGDARRRRRRAAARAGW